MKKYRVLFERFYDINQKTSSENLPVNMTMDQNVSNPIWKFQWPQNTYFTQNRSMHIKNDKKYQNLLGHFYDIKQTQFTQNLSIITGKYQNISRLIRLLVRHLTDKLFSKSPNTYKKRILKKYQVLFKYFQDIKQTIHWKYPDTYEDWSKSIKSYSYIFYYCEDTDFTQNFLIHV